MKREIKIVREELYRSDNKVNMTEDMVRVTITMPRMSLGKLKRFLVELTMKREIKIGEKND